MSESRQPLISVVMPCYNACAYLELTLRSVLSQSVADLEIVLVDDGSTDDPEAIVRAIGDARIRYQRTPPSGGPSRPRNLGVEAARGRYVFFFDADDLMLPGKIAAQLELMEREPGLALTFTNFRVVDPQGATLNDDFLAGYETFGRLRGLVAGGAGRLPRDAFYLGLLRANFIGTSSVAVRREVLAEVGGFDVGLASGEDIDLWLRIARNHDCGYVDVVGHAYRSHPTSVMHQFEARHPLARIEVVRRHLPYVTDPATRRTMIRRLADNHASLGYIWQVRGDAGLARGNYLASLRLAPSGAALGGYLKCLVGGPFLRRPPKGGA